MLSNFEEAKVFIEENDIKMIDFRMIDLNGRWHHLTIPAERFTESTMTAGIGFDGSNYGFAPVEKSDMVFIPDLSSAAIDDFCEMKTLSMIGDVRIIGKEENDKPAEELRAFLETLGDCVVVAEDEDIIKVHVHTENPGKALEEALTYGQLLTVKIENMKEQHRKAAEKYAKEQAAAEAAQKKKEELRPVSPEKETGFVAVASGEGLVSLFGELGCDHVVSGGQSMNPSTEDIYEAVMATPARTVFVLPNNKNIILAAEQVIPLVEDREVIIIPSRTIPQGLVAMLSYAPDSTNELNREYMISSLANVSTGQVTYAARNSEFGLTKIKEGDIIALNNGKLTGKEKDPVKAVVKLAKEMISRDTTYVSLIYGEGITDDQANAAMEAIEAKTGGNVEISLVDGGQPIYYFILSVE